MNSKIKNGPKVNSFKKKVPLYVKFHTIAFFRHIFQLIPRLLVTQTESTEFFSFSQAQTNTPAKLAIIHDALGIPRKIETSFV